MCLRDWRVWAGEVWVSGNGNKLVPDLEGHCCPGFQGSLVEGVPSQLVEHDRHTAAVPVAASDEASCPALDFLHRGLV